MTKKTMTKRRIGTIRQEAAACRKAWKGLVGHAGHLINHDRHYGYMQTPEIRISYILTGKPVKERAARLHFMRPAPKVKGRKEWHARTFPDCPWGKKECAAVWGGLLHSSEVDFSLV